jgi:uncharacterized membrane protein YdbT with pleckstrin-like domain
VGSYVQDSLNANEQIKYLGRLSLWGYSGRFLGGALLLIGALWMLGSAVSSTSSHAGQGAFGTFLLAGAGLLIGWPFLARRFTELAITDSRLIAKFGIISTHSLEIRLDKVETVRVKQTLIGKLLNYGDLMVTGTGTTFDPIPNVAKPLVFRSALNQAMESRSAK